MDDIDQIERDSEILGMGPLVTANQIRHRKQQEALEADRVRKLKEKERRDRVNKELEEEFAKMFGGDKEVSNRDVVIGISIIVSIIAYFVWIHCSRVQDESPKSDAVTAPAAQP